MTAERAQQEIETHASSISAGELQNLEQQSKSSIEEWKRIEAWPEYRHLENLVLKTLRDERLSDETSLKVLASRLGPARSALQDAHPDLDERGFENVLRYIQFKLVARRIRKLILPFERLDHRVSVFASDFGDAAVTHVPLLQYVLHEMGHDVAGTAIMKRLKPLSFE